MKKNPWCTAILILALGFLLGIGTSAVGRERHPVIYKAQKQLKNAKETLEHGARDFGGHRVKAIEHIDAALDELHTALDFDKD
jgi:hypothetical protein